MIYGNSSRKSIKLMKTKVISEAKSIGCIFDRKEVQTVELITHYWKKRRLFHCLDIKWYDEFRKIEDLTKLEKGEFDIPEPKNNAK
ncbi:MAG: hypothetical protein Ct9H300mP17_05120 [Candidatus Nitrosopelagicus sp.]|nr:MAG: hypothetical protein Ct9H300mP17_05120 [Candidatus Nitrosopelagicus sp.]